MAFNKRPVSHPCSMTLGYSSVPLSAVCESPPLSHPILKCRLEQQAPFETDSPCGTEKCSSYFCGPRHHVMSAHIPMAKVSLTRLCPTWLGPSNDDGDEDEEDNDVNNNKRTAGNTIPPTVKVNFHLIHTQACCPVHWLQRGLCLVLEKLLRLG